MKHRIFSIALLQMLIWNPGNGCLADNLTNKELQETDLETVSTGRSNNENTTRKWSLQECIDYALENNIQIKKNKATEEQEAIGLKENKAALLPSLSFSMNQSLSYRPLQETTSNLVANGIASSSSNKLTENGSYGLNASWTVWDGGANLKNVKVQELNQQMAALTTETSQNSIQEQIVQLYIQILYSEEALKVNDSLCATAQKQYDRGVVMTEEGLMSQAELAQLKSQLSSSQYDVVNTRTIVAGYKLQLKQLLELNNGEAFDIQPLEVTDEAVLELIPTTAEVYQAALQQRPEIKNKQLEIEAADLNISIARAGYSPSLSLNAAISDSHYSASQMNVGQQMKENLNGTVGLSLSIPIFDNRRNKSAVEKAKVARLTSELDLQEEQKNLYSTIENYWLQATSNQQKYLASKAKSASMASSYTLLNEQFENGLKNIVELLTGRDDLLSAEQERLQSKYTTLLNIQMLQFYKGEKMNM